MEAAQGVRHSRVGVGGRDAISSTISHSERAMTGTDWKQMIGIAAVMISNSGAICIVFLAM
jgi:hypothetical protein